MGRALTFAVTVGSLAQELGLQLIGDATTPILRVDDAAAASVGSLCFAKNDVWAAKAAPDAVLLTSAVIAASRAGRATLVSESPRLDFARALSALEKLAGFVWSGSEPDVHPTAKIGSHVFLGKGVRVGADTVIHHNVVIGDEVIIGERCVIKSCAVIGEEGFGFERDHNGHAVRLPHIGTVFIENDVEVGSLTTVCRGTLSDTTLRRGCKIDDHVHIAHNIDVGQDAFVIACAEVSGGVKIGPRAWIAPNASIMNQVTVGADAVVGLGGVVVKSVPDGVTVIGNPAKPLQR